MRIWNNQTIKNYILENSECEILTEYIANADEKISLKCSCGNIFETYFRKFKDRNKRQCNTCGKQKVWKNRERPTIESISNFVEKISNCKVIDDTYVANNVGLKLMCGCGREFKKSWIGINKSKDNLECLKCSTARKTKKQTATNSDFLNKLSIVHGEKYIPLEEYTTSNTKIKLLCNMCGNNFYSKPSHLYDGHGCPHCVRKSQGEDIILSFLKNNNIPYLREFKFCDCKGNCRVLPFDFAIFKEDKIHLLIEFDGEQHFRPKGKFDGEIGFAERVYNDAIKNSYCEDNNIKLIRIPYWEIKNIENILKNSLTL